MRTRIVYRSTTPLLQIVHDADVIALVLSHIPYQQFWGGGTIVALVCFSATPVCANNINNNNNNNVLHLYCLITHLQRGNQTYEYMQLRNRTVGLR